MTNVLDLPLSRLRAGKPEAAVARGTKGSHSLLASPEAAWELRGPTLNPREYAARMLSIILV